MFFIYFFFSGIINIFITINIMCFLSMIILFFNHNNKDNNINSYLFKIVYIPLIFILFIISDKSLDLIISLYIFFCLYFDLSFLYFGGNFDYLLVKPKGSGAVPGPNGNNNGFDITTSAAYGTLR